MSLNNIFSIEARDLKELPPDDAVEVFRELLWVEAMACGIQPSLITVPGAITVKDGGVDAVVLESPKTSGQGVIKKGHTSYQIKTGKFQISTKKGVKDILFKKDSTELKPGIADCLNKSGTLVVVLFGNDSPSPSDSKIKKTLQDTLQTVSKKFKKAKIVVWRINNLIGFLSRYPGLALTVKRGTPRKFIPHQAWARLDLMKPSLKLGPAQEQLVKALQSELRRNDQPVHASVQGEAGVGKTRLVLEATRPEDLRPLVIYLESPSALLNSDLIEYLTWGNEHVNAILVVDECDARKRAEIWNKIKDYSPRLKFISIYNEIDSFSQVGQFIAPPLEEPQIVSIISEYIGAEDQARRWAQYCGGSPRVAHVVGTNLKKNPDDILRTPDTVDIWDRYITGADNPDSDLVRKRRLVLNHLALFQRFGFEKPLYDEAKSILGLINNIDPNLTEADFIEAIRGQRKRKTLQGNTTLYISPKLFHIWLWADWWNTYGTTFSWQSIDKLPNKLKDWFLEMFEYAKESQSAEQVVTELLAPGGPFENFNILNSKRGSSFFFRLAKSNPGNALATLERAFEGKTKANLLAFIDGRREVIYSLELIAIYREYFIRAARLVLLLAEAENENWGNNASGVFAELFSSGYGTVATSEASPLERMPVLEEALKSTSSEVQMLGLKACDYALEADHWTRGIGNQLAGLKSEPQRWTPKTYGEIWAGYRAVWSLVIEQLDHFGEKEKLFAANVLLKRARGLIFRTKLWDMVIETMLDFASRPDLRKKDVIQTVEKIIHFDQNKLPPDIVNRLIETRTKLVGNDFPSLIKRYAGMDLIEDRYHEDGTQSDSREEILNDLAIKSIKSPTLLIPELHWLITTEAENGYSFGYALGKLDTNLSLLKSIIDAQKQCRENCSVYFLSGYGRALGERSMDIWETHLKDFSKETNCLHLVPELAWRTGAVSKNIIMLIDNLIEEKKISINSLERFAYGNARELIDRSVYIHWIERLLKDGTSSSISIATELFYSSIVRNKTASDSEFPHQLAIAILTHPTWFMPRGSRANQMDDYNWNELGKKLVEECPQKALKLSEVLLEKFGTKGSIVESSFSQGVEVLYKIAEQFPIEFWEQLKKYLGPPIDIRAFQFRHWLRGDLGDAPSPLPLIPPSELWAWVDEDIENRAWNLAGMVPKAWFKEEKGKTCLARQILVRYGNRKDVRRELRSTFWSGSWWGPESAHLAGQIDFLLSIKKEDPNKHVRKWIDEYIADLSPFIDSAKIREERSEF